MNQDPNIYYIAYAGTQTFCSKCGRPAVKIKKSKKDPNVNQKLCQSCG